MALEEVRREGKNVNMAKYVITLETDNESIEEVESCLQEMIDNHLDCTAKNV